MSYSIKLVDIVNYFKILLNNIILRFHSEKNLNVKGRNIIIYIYILDKMRSFNRDDLRRRFFGRTITLERS